MKKCAICKEPFEPVFSSLEKWCSNPDKDCQFEYAMQVVEKNRKQKELAAKKEWTETKKVYRDNTKKKSEYEAELQVKVNKLARLIDAGCGCTSCGTHNTVRWDGGHFHSVGAASSIRYNLFNIYIQCGIQCNGFKGGNQTAYAEMLGKIFGQKHREFVQFELMQTPAIKLSIGDFKRLNTEANLLIKEFEAANKLVQLPRNASERLEMREYVNSRMKIY